MTLMAEPGPQFEQLSMPGMPKPAPTPVAPRAHLAPEDGGYTSAHTMQGDWEKTRIPPSPDPHVEREIGANWRNERSQREEFIPTFRTTTRQETVNTEAVEHQVTHANPMDLNKQPEVFSYNHPDGAESFHVSDGNHRVNAALRRGQLLMPADVWRDRRAQGVPSVRQSEMAGKKKAQQEDAAWAAQAPAVPSDLLARMARAVNGPSGSL